MTDLPGDHPLPHPELHTQTPLMFTMKVGDVLYRHHQIINDPIHFGWLGTIGSTIRIVLQAGLSEFSMQAKILTAVSSSHVAPPPASRRSREFISTNGRSLSLS